MCGFVIVLSADSAPSDLAAANRMADLIAHRGPDDAGSFSENGIAMAFRRLAIFDLADSSHQPMVSADGRYVIVFNGAIYNFPELRSELEALGHTFRTSGDTEVLLTAYVEWGSECLRRLNGMWAFAIYDRTTRRIFVSRDRFGVKPIFWHHDGRALAITSEIKALRDSEYARSAPNWEVIARYLLEDHLDSSNSTFYAGIHRVPAGCFFEGDARSPPVFRRYWSLEDVMEEDEPSAPIEEFRALFGDAVRLRMRADVPIGVMLSGGLDSTSVISSVAEQSATLGAGPVTALCYLDPHFDESPQIAATLEQTRASQLAMHPDYERLWDAFERHVWHQDEPAHSMTSLVIFELMRIARAHGLKVMLSGQGADETLAGYPQFFLDYWTDLVASGQLVLAQREMTAFASCHGRPLKALRGAVGNRLLSRLKQLVPGYRTLSGARRRAAIQNDPWISDDVKRQWHPGRERYPRTLRESLRLSVERAALPLYLRVEDRNSMAHAVEVRMPFLDHRLVSLAFRLRSRWKLSGPYTKAVLRTAMEDKIPEVVRTHVQKLGFPSTTNGWFMGKLREYCRDALSSRALRESDIWNLAEVERSLELDPDRAPDREEHGRNLFRFAQFHMWLQLSRFGILLGAFRLVIAPAL
ncbi:MAG TPA: asparagine synthase (glutamine-hydrolyzing) [Gammaproteobacteria bacterium]|nr:asparagine synthase (glutamine-hydrolyzing) [Gammaproteobacteria bacterium]